MFLAEYVNRPELEPFLIEVEAGDYLFRQGQMGIAMFLILDGMVQLLDENGEEQHLIGSFGPGQFFGEKALSTGRSHQRFFSAHAQIKTLVLSVSVKDLPEIERVVPNFMFLMFQAATQRLDQAYYLIKILKASDDMDRVIHSILYFYRSAGLGSAASQLSVLTFEDIRYLLNMDKTKLTACLDFLVNRNILVKRPNDCYLLRDEQALVQVLVSDEAKLAS